MVNFFIPFRLYFQFVSRIFSVFWPSSRPTAPRAPPTENRSFFCWYTAHRSPATAADRHRFPPRPLENLFIIGIQVQYYLAFLYIGRSFIFISIFSSLFYRLITHIVCVIIVYIILRTTMQSVFVMQFLNKQKKIVPFYSLDI